MNLLHRLVALGLGIAGLFVLGCSDSRTTASSVEILEVRRGDFSRQMLLTGELVAEDAMAMTTPNANIWPMVVRWIAEDGIEVKAGDEVLEFDNSQLTVNLEEQRLNAMDAENRLGSRRAELAGAIAQAEFAVEEKRATRDKARIEADVPEGILEQREYETRRLALMTADFELEEAERKLATVQGTGEAEIAVERIAMERALRQVEKAESGIELMVLRAPRDGVLLVAENPREDRPFQNGDNTYPGRTVARLPDLASMVVEARLFDVDDGRIQPGQEVTATLDAFPSELYRGRVREVDGIAREVGRRSLRRFFRAVVELDGLDTNRMRPGMSVKLVVDATRKSDVLLVPRASLDWSLETPRALLADGSWAEVTLGECSTTVCILERGPDEGSRLRRAAGGETGGA